ncbi:hypothetical protein SD37_10125 [Amycolatopsis orientalis]|uniref:Glyoxalase-like domain-containing protein n=1 Tax=Amycolatopsis orientalis TaxID=31958 RepID=A0A193BUR8_AMYOR|nr:VOC family protein [Amycolatopsis orientalis]ANN15962.1 hypothetical protein SD37_10125 [Amycolatopsis orientalis]
MKCSHVLLKVDDLHQAVRDFRELGFTVDYASAERKARHAHIWFRTGPIVELLTTPPGASLMALPLNLAFGRGGGPRMTRWARAAEGFCDAAVLAGREELRRAGRVVDWKRTKPDGSTTKFAFTYPREDRAPFLVPPYEPPQHPEKVVHANGAEAVSRVIVDVASADSAAFDRLTAGGEFELRTADVTAIRAVELAGLKAELDPALLHGACFLPR